MSASALEWTLPPELVPFPPLALDVPVLSLAGAGSRELDGGSRGPRWGMAPSWPFRGVGSGRLAVAGLPATWLWRMEGGALAEHRTFWRRMMEWGRRGRGPEGVGHAVGGRRSRGRWVRLPVEWTGSAPPPASPCATRMGTEDPLEVAVLSPGRGTAAFVPRRRGVSMSSWTLPGEGIAADSVSGSAPLPPGAFFRCGCAWPGPPGGASPRGAGRVGGEAGGPLPSRGP